MATYTFSNEDARDKYAKYVEETKKILAGQMKESDRTVSDAEAGRIYENYCTGTVESGAEQFTGSNRTYAKSADDIEEISQKSGEKIFETTAGGYSAPKNTDYSVLGYLTSGTRSVVMGDESVLSGAGSSVTADYTTGSEIAEAESQAAAVAYAKSLYTAAPAKNKVSTLGAPGIRTLADGDLTAEEEQAESDKIDEAIASGELKSLQESDSSDSKSTDSSSTGTKLTTLYQKNNARLVDFTFMDGSDDSKRRAYMQLQGEVTAIKELISGDNATILQEIYDHLIDKYTSVVIVRIEENLQEKQHVMPTVGDSFAATFSGAEPQLMNITGYLPFDGNTDNSWFMAFLNAYKIFIRASRLARYRCNLKLVFPDFNTYTCYPVSINCGMSSEQDNLIMFNMVVLITNNPINKAYGFTSSTTASTNPVESTAEAATTEESNKETGTDVSISETGGGTLDSNYAVTTSNALETLNSGDTTTITASNVAAGTADYGLSTASLLSARPYADTGSISDAEYGSSNSAIAARNLYIKRLAFITLPGNTGAIDVERCLEYGVRDNQISYLDNYLGKAYE